MGKSKELIENEGLGGDSDSIMLKQPLCRCKDKDASSLLISASTAFHALEVGFRTVLIDDCSRGIDEKNIEAAYEKIQSWHGLVVQSSEVKNMVLGRDRRPELGYKLALEFRNSTMYPAKNKNSKYNGGSCNPDGTLIVVH